jgi:hypothetical protein
MTKITNEVNIKTKDMITDSLGGGYKFKGESNDHFIWISQIM